MDSSFDPWAAAAERLRDDSEGLDELRKLEMLWRCRAPSSYRRFDLSRHPDPAAHAESLRLWREINVRDTDAQPDKMGLILCGGSGAGKTFSAYEIIQQVVCANFDGCGYLPATHAAVDLARVLRTDSYGTDREVAAAFRLLREDPTDEDHDRMDGGYILGVEAVHWWTIEGLFLDDLHMARGSKRWLEELYALVETLMQDRRPLLVTSQVSGNRLIELMTGRDADLRETAEAIVRRLRDYCAAVEFRRGPPSP